MRMNAPNYQIFSQLHPDCIAIRTAVFVQEQGFSQEFDEIDARANHVLVYDEGIAAATGRLYALSEDTYCIGRVAVLASHRGKHLGAIVVQALETYAREYGAQRIVLSAQCRAAAFYEKLGYTRTDDYHMDELCPHVTMQKTLAGGKEFDYVSGT